MATGYVTGVTADDDYSSSPRIANVPTGFPTRMSYSMNSHRLRVIDNPMKRDKDFNVPTCAKPKRGLTNLPFCPGGYHWHAENRMQGS